MAKVLCCRWCKALPGTEHNEHCSYLVRVRVGDERIVQPIQCIEQDPTFHLYTAEELFSVIWNNPGVAYRELVEGLVFHEHRAFRTALGELFYDKRINMVHFQHWQGNFDLVIRYFPISKGEMKVFAAGETMQGAQLFTYDPFETLKEVSANA